MVDLVRPDVQNILYAILRDQIETQAEVLPNVPQFLDTTTAIIYDSVHAFALALHQLRSVQQVHQMNLDCSGQILKDLSIFVSSTNHNKCMNQDFEYNGSLENR